MRLEKGLYRIDLKNADWALRGGYVQILEYKKGKNGGQYKYKYVPDTTKFGTSTRSAVQLENSLIPLSSLEKELY
jgi:hypothetical protein